MPTPARADPLLLRAHRFALEAHGTQRRKDGRTPYIVHPVAVMRHASTDLRIADPEILAAALLHDVVEDTPTPREAIAAEFGDRVARLVEELTLPPGFHGPGAEEDAKTRRLVEDASRMSADALAIKLCDRWDNLDDSANLAWDDVRREGFRAQTHQILAVVQRRLAREPFTPEERRRIEAGIAGVVAKVGKPA
ncbi:MAG: HD domain-containing protein [Thermoplasmata archaeon]